MTAHSNSPTKILTPDELHLVARWRLVLGAAAEEAQIGCTGDSECQRIEQLLGFLYQPTPNDETPTGVAPPQQRQGGTGDSQLTVPYWVDSVAELFPQQAKEVMQRELVDRRGIGELLDRPDVLEKIEPSQELVKTLLTHKDLLNTKTRSLARKIIQRVVNEVKEKMKLQVTAAITGALRKDRHSPRRVFRNLDLKTTIRRNLKNYDQQSEKLLVDRLFFYAAERKRRPWHVIIAVDQSGSMLDSAIFSAVMASIFAELPSVRTSLFLFDTNIADLSDMVGEPVDVLLSIQLGGGTDITKALQYAETLVREPQRSIVVLITDFFEGRDGRDLVGQTKRMAEGGIRMIGLGALGYNARPQFDREMAKRCRKVGMDILVCTPEKLAECMAEIIRG